MKWHPSPNPRKCVIFRDPACPLRQFRLSPRSQSRLGQQDHQATSSVRWGVGHGQQRFGSPREAAAAPPQAPHPFVSPPVRNLGPSERRSDGTATPPSEVAPGQYRTANVEQEFLVMLCVYQVIVGQSRRHAASSSWRALRRISCVRVSGSASMNSRPTASAYRSTSSRLSR